MKSQTPRTLKESIEYMKKLKELGYEPYIKGIGNGKVKICIDTFIPNQVKQGGGKKS